MPDIVGAFVGGLAKFLFSVLKDRLDRPEREQRRQSHAEKANRNEQARVAAERCLAEYQAGEALRRIDRESVVRRYPLGEPGRLRQYYRTGEQPCVMIAPLTFHSQSTDISVDVFGILNDAPGSAGRFQAIPDAVIADNGKARRIRRADVVEIAALEFPEQPALIIFFELSAGLILSQAYFWNMFPTTTGDEVFLVRIARYRRGTKRKPVAPPRMSIEPSALPSFTDIDLPTTDVKSLEVISTTVALFVAATLDIYWYTRGQNSDLFRSLAPDERACHDEHADGAQPQSFTERIAAELETIRQAGFNCEPLGVFGEQTVFAVTLASRTIILLLPEAYPKEPPKVQVISSGTPTTYEFETGSWTSERTLAEILGGF